ncbi:MAG: hypothetical protein ABJQ33_03605 [Alloalcanivorax venustensis]
MSQLIRLTLIQPQLVFMKNKRRALRDTLVNGTTRINDAHADPVRRH